ncbi:hypothetical protein HELRODRAFT_153427, partial [Helobdella robusta]|uniref:PDZ domain-containing protein n=1 Tax=Helobdella robusta TaxID=6412 RepID=T1EL74_HELRO
TPTPIELLKVVISKAKDKEDFGFSLSDGVFEKGVYVGAVRAKGPASTKLKPFDRILQAFFYLVNNIKSKDMECSQLVPLIASSGNTLELVITRNP